jgi:transcriptional regulator with XRE-family HTH domain
VRTAYDQQRHGPAAVAALDFGAVAAEWVRALRGRRSQSAFSRRLGYSNSVVHRWEAGRAWPTAARMLVACEANGRDVGSAYPAFFRRRPPWLEEHAPAGRAAVAAFLTASWSKVAIERLEQRAPGHFGYSLFAISRADLRRLRELHVEYLREMQSIIAHSKPDECVGLLCLQLLDLSTRPDNALAER